MSTAERLETFSQDDLRAEVAELRKEMLPLFIVGLVCLGLGWFCRALFQVGAKGPEVLPTIILLLTAAVAYVLSKKHYFAACWSLLLGMTLAQGAIVAVHPSALMMACGVIVIITANALLGTGGALSAAALAWASAWAGRNMSMSGLEQSSIRAGDLTAFYFLMTVACWIAARPMMKSVDWSLVGWARAREALAEVRERRGEIYRTLRSLEEATFRIERMNNELIIARHEAELARAIKARFVSMVSHELRSPLNLILGFSRLMVLSPESYGGPLPRVYRMDVDTIYRNAQHLVSLVDDILDLSQIEAQHLPLVKDRLDFSKDVVAKVVDMMRPLARRKGLYLRVQSPGELPWILADQVRLRQALLNLLTNAIRFTERGGITVRTGAENGSLLVTVQDTGYGIAAEEIPKLFQEFHQVHRTETREEGGSGLGLAIAKHLVELHGGRIWVESHLGLGTTFYFTLPLPDTELLNPYPVSTKRSDHSRMRNTILVMHDDPSVVRLLGRRIEGYHAMGFSDVGEVIKLTEQLHPQALVTPPEYVEHIQELMSHTPFDVPIISCVLPRMEEDSDFESVLGYLVKPITQMRLSTVMEPLQRDEEMIILVVDDDPDAVRLLERILMAIPHRYRILKAYDGMQALGIAAKVVPDVVFLDLLMPGLDGRQVIHQLRADERTRKVPVVIVSALDWREEGALLGTSLSVHHRKPMDIAKGTKYLQVLLDTFRPIYLPTPEAFAQFEATSPDKLASARQHLRQEQMLGGAR